jgi:esterase/lipase superfamily enzyme
MLTPHTFSRWIAAATIATLLLGGLDFASAQTAPELSPRRLVRKPVVVSKAEEALIRARLAMKAKNFAVAYAEYRAALKLAARTGPEHDEALRGFSESGVELAQQRLKERRAADAERITREVLAANATYRPAVELLAKIKPPPKADVPVIGAGPPPQPTAAPKNRSTLRREKPQPTPPPGPEEEEAPTMAEAPKDLPEEGPPPPPPHEQPSAPAAVHEPLVKVYFATDREHISGASGPSKYFGTEWNQDPDPDGQHLVTGFLKISIPPVHKPGQLERPFKVWIFEAKENDKEHIVLKELRVLKGDDFYGALRKEYDDRPEDKRSAFIFIHGFKTSFDDAAYRTAQIAYDLNFPGVPIMYSWPSRDNLLAYVDDAKTADWSWQHLQYFVERVARESGALRIHLIAHSMGNRLLVNALDGLGRQPEIKPLFDNVIMAAPDVDAKPFIDTNWAGIRDAAKRFTLYASSDDWALKASRHLNDLARLGEAGGTLVVIPGLDTVDASGIDTNELGHSYYHCKKLMDDLQLLMTKGWPPMERKLLNRPKGDLAYWAFP